MPELGQRWRHRVGTLAAHYIIHHVDALFVYCKSANGGSKLDIHDVNGFVAAYEPVRPVDARELVEALGHPFRHQAEQILAHLESPTRDAAKKQEAGE